MRLSYQYRLYPLCPQLLQLSHARHELTYLWNYALEERQRAWKLGHRSVSYLDQQRSLTRWRAFDRAGVGSVPVGFGQDCLQRLDLAFRAFFRRIRAGERPGYPHFRHETRSLTFSPRTPPLVPGRHRTWRLDVPVMGGLPIRYHRPLPQGAVVKTVTLSCVAGVWFATLSLELPNPPPPAPELPRHPVGVDLGLTHLLTLSDGRSADPPHAFAALERRIGRAQRCLARKRRGSERYARQRQRVARLHARVRRQRRWLLPQLAHDLATDHDLVVMEDLSVPPLARTPLAKSIYDAGWGTLRTLTAYKLHLRSKRSVLVPARGTTQECAACGRRSDPPLTLSDREFRCRCGHRQDRDANAASVILQRGLARVGRKPPEQMRVEGPPPPTRVGRRVYQRRRADPGKRELALATGTPGGKPSAREMSEAPET